jgi:hypothetical protein
MRAWIAIGALAWVAVAQEGPVIRVPVRLVTVPALVLSADGRPVNGLQAADFRLFDDGNLQPFTLDTEVTPASLVIVVQANSAVRSYPPFILLRRRVA